jgi:hypothetical protein
MVDSSRLKEAVNLAHHVHSLLLKGSDLSDLGWRVRSFPVLEHLTQLESGTTEFRYLNIMESDFYGSSDLTNSKKRIMTMKDFRYLALLPLSIAVLALVAVAPAAYADTVTVSASVPDTTSINTVSSLSVDQFYSAPGIVAGDTLTGVELILSGDGTTVYSVTYSGTGTATVSEFSTLASLNLTSSVPTITLSLSGTDILSPVTSLTNGQGFTSTPQSIIGSSVNSFPLPTTPFDGSGLFTFTLSGSANSGDLSDIPSGGTLSLSPTTEAGGTIEAIYTYDTPGGSTTPEPGTLLMFGTGLLGLAGMLRFKYLQAR